MKKGKRENKITKLRRFPHTGEEESDKELGNRKLKKGTEEKNKIKRTIMKKRRWRKRT